jgi:hypothetical protein
MLREEVAPDRASAWSLPDLVVTVCLGQEFRLEVFDDRADRFDQNESPEKWKLPVGDLQAEPVEGVLHSGV